MRKDRHRPRERSRHGQSEKQAASTSAHQEYYVLMRRTTLTIDEDIAVLLDRLQKGVAQPSRAWSTKRCGVACGRWHRRLSRYVRLERDPSIWDVV
jgi:hypothetical protein